MSTFTALEQRVFALMQEDHPAIAGPLADLTERARVTERDNTGAGFYTSFDIARDRVSWPPDRRMVDGPRLDVKVGDEVLMMGFILWAREGWPDCLEGYRYATRTGERLDLANVGLETLVPMDRTVWPPR